MSLERIKLELCQNEVLIQSLSEQKKELLREIKEQIQIIKNMDEYQEYLKNPDSEISRKKLSEKEQFQKYLSMKIKIDSIEEQYNREMNNCTIEEFNFLNKLLSCEHLFYKKSTGEKICIKCLYNKEKIIKLKNSNLRELNYSYLLIELRNYYANKKITSKVLSWMFQNEDLEYLIKLTQEIIAENKNITTPELETELKIRIARLNIELIEQMYTDINSMDLDTKKNYSAYKKILKKLKETK